MLIVRRNLCLHLDLVQFAWHFLGCLIHPSEAINLYLAFVAFISSECCWSHRLTCLSIIHLIEVLVNADYGVFEQGIGFFVALICERGLEVQVPCLLARRSVILEQKCLLLAEHFSLAREPSFLCLRLKSSFLGLHSELVNVAEACCNFCGWLCDLCALNSSNLVIQANIAAVSNNSTWASVLHILFLLSEARTHLWLAPGSRIISCVSDSGR